MVSDVSAHFHRVNLSYYRWGFKSSYYVQTQQEGMRKHLIPQDGVSIDLDVRQMHQSFDVDTNGTSPVVTL